MYTRCQSCHTVHAVNAALLARSGGRFRCGKCKSVGNALDALFDEWPDAGAKPSPPGSLPELGTRLDLAGPTGDNAATEEAVSQGESTGSDAGGTRIWLRALWMIAAFALALIVSLYVARYFGMPLPDRATLDAALVKIGLREAPPPPPFRALDRIEIVSREMRAHPDRPGVLQLDATLVNRAGRSQAYPQIDVALLDIAGRAIARQGFAPAAYLGRAVETARGMTPDAYVAISLTMPDPGDEAVGFEIEFR
jgi:predicted Zn finger-like uncharacterized protein